MSEMLERLGTEQRNHVSDGIDAKPTEEILRIINTEDRRVAESITPEIPRIAEAVDGIAARLSQGGRLFYIGAGTSGRLGVLDASECRPTFNVPEGAVQGIIAGGEAALVRATEASEDDLSSGARDLLSRGFTGIDVLVGIAASGRTPYVLGAIRQARMLGALTVGISCTPDSLLSQEVHIPIEPLPGPEVVTGSTRMKAGTATKLVLNMLSTGAMIRLGYVYGNLMVNVQPTNDKLRDRATRIIMDASGVAREEAARVLDESGRSVRTAIVMARKSLDREAAERLLAAHGNRISEALEAS
jgi:N-acetylmuramic acid 6-phosphate etherase